MKKVTVYTTNYCPFCHAAKSLLNNKNIPFDSIDVSNDPEKRAWLVEVSGQRTVPQIFIGEQSIGGFQELQGLDSQGLLDQMLQD